MSQQKVTFIGSVDMAAPVGSPSGQPQTLISYNEISYTEKVLSQNIFLGVDTPVAVSLGQLSGVNFLSIRADGAKIRVRITSTDGSTQAVPVDPLLVLRCDSTDITAIDITRTAGIDTDVYIVLGKKS